MNSMEPTAVWSAILDELDEYAQCRKPFPYLRGARHGKVEVGEAPLHAPGLLMRMRLGELGHVQRMEAVNVFLGADAGEHDVFVDMLR